jgi:hypothetical protein
VRFLVTYARAAGMRDDLRGHARQATSRAARWRRHEAQRIRMNALFETWNQQLAAELADPQAAAVAAAAASRSGARH